MSKKKSAAEGLRLVIGKAALVRLTTRLADAAAKSAIPILATAHLAAEPGRLVGRATDLDCEIEVAEAAEIAGAGALCVDAAKLAAIASALADGAEIELALEADRLKLRSGRTNAALHTLPVEDFPVLAAAETPHRFTLAAADLEHLLGRVAFAMSTEQTRYYLCGICLHALEPPGRPAELRATAKARFGLVMPVTHAGDRSQRARDLDEPLPTITTAKRGERAFVTAAFGEREGQAPRIHSIEDPAPTICAQGRVNLVEGAEDDPAAPRAYDIRFRMLEPAELAGAMSLDGHIFLGTKQQKTKQIGNAVPAETAAALVAALFA